MRPTYANIDLAAIRHNTAAIADFIAPSEVCTVVKADGYGHGDAPVASAALEAGATRLAVALVEEGMRLREAGISAPILVLAQPSPADAADFGRWELTPTVYTEEFVIALSEAGYAGGVHFKVDTGMHRVGANPDQIESMLKSIAKAGLDVDGIFTHFPVADSDPTFTDRQIELFDSVVPDTDALIHMANTPGALLFPAARRDFARIGLGTYGLHPCDATRELVDLRPAMSVVTSVVHIQSLKEGARPSYGRRRPLESDAKVATIPIGYADGFWRNLSETGSVLIGGRRFPLSGTVTMDQTMVTVGDKDIALGDEVVLIGWQDEESIGVDEWAAQLDTISYEVVCSIGPRVPRRYFN